MTASRAWWDFDYRPAADWGAGHAPTPTCDLVVALESHVPLERVRAALTAHAADLVVEEILARPPLFRLRFALS